MTSSFEVLNPGEMEMKLTMTMKLKNWEELQSQLAYLWPSSDLSYQIRDMVKQAKQSFYPCASSPTEPQS